MGKYTANDLDPGAYKPGSLREPTRLMSNPVSVGDDLVERLEFKAQVAFDANKKVGRRGKEWAITEELEWKAAAALREAASQLAAVTAERDALQRLREHLEKNNDGLVSSRLAMKDRYRTRAIEAETALTTSQVEVASLREALEAAVSRGCDHCADSIRTALAALNPKAPS